MLFVVESLTEHDLDLLCITETWLLPSDVAVISAALPPSYSFYHVPRSTNARGGGVGLICSKALINVKFIPNHPDISSFEFLEITFRLGVHNVRMAIVYRPGHPGTDRVFMDEFAQFLEGLSVYREKLVICGDFNYWLDNPLLKPYSDEFMRLLDTNNMANHVLAPTHISGHTLDLILAPVGVDFIHHVEVSPIDHKISDHALVTFELKVIRPSTYSKKITFRNYRGLNVPEMSSIIRDNLVGTITGATTSEQCVDSYNRGFVSLRDRFCPLTTKEIKIRDDSEWYDHRVVSLRRERRRAERRWRKAGTEATRILFVSARRAVVKQLYTCKIEYYQHQMSLCDGDQRRTYTFLNNLLGRKMNHVLPTSTSYNELSSRFSSFFSDKIIRIRMEIDAVVVAHDFSLDFPLRFTRSSTFSHFTLVTEADVLKYIKETRKTYCCLDPINTSKLGEAYEAATPAVAAIVNSSFVEGHFATSEKRGLIRPYLKKIGLNADDLSNYRPVTNLSHLSKIMERAMLDQLVPYLEEVGVVPHRQSAYRKLHSTETALCKIYDDLVYNTCRGKTSLLVLLDLSAAFDTVDHQLLLSDFSDCGVEGTALSLLESYLENREQCVSIDESQSEPTSLQYGVPQGSVLGPVLFTVYTGTLAFLLNAHGVSYHFYADDTQVYIRIEDIDDAKHRISLLLSDIKVWMARRKLKLNDGKTEIIVIKGNLKNVPVANFGVLNLGDTQLVPCESAKNLGVVLDSSLSFRPHIDSIVKTCNFHIRNLYLIRDFVNKKNLITLVHSLIISKVDYCNSLFIGLPNVTLKKIQSILNRAARLIFNLPPRVPTTSSLIELHWLPVKARVEFKICLITYKALKFNQPSYIKELLTFSSHGSTLGLRSADDPYRLHEPRAVGERGFASRSFSYTAPRLYNKLPIAIKQSESLSTFKSHLKTFLFSRAYDLSGRMVREDYAL